MDIEKLDIGEQANAIIVKGVLSWKMKQDKNSSSRTLKDGKKFKLAMTQQKYARLTRFVFFEDTVSDQDVQNCCLNERDTRFQYAVKISDIEGSLGPAQTASSLRCRSSRPGCPSASSRG